MDLLADLRCIHEAIPTHWVIATEINLLFRESNQFKYKSDGRDALLRRHLRPASINNYIHQAVAPSTNTFLYHDMFQHQGTVSILKKYRPTCTGIPMIKIGGFRALSVQWTSLYLERQSLYWGRTQGYEGRCLDSKVHGAYMEPTRVLSAPDGPHVCPMNLAISVGLGRSPYG